MLYFVGFTEKLLCVGVNEYLENNLLNSSPFFMMTFLYPEGFSKDVFIILIFVPSFLNESPHVVSFTTMWILSFKNRAEKYKFSCTSTPKEPTNSV